MSDSYQIHDQGGCYFVTFQVIGWVDVFTRRIYRDIVVDSLNYCAEKKGLQVHAWVIMSNHVHSILSSATNQLSNTVRDLKRHTANKIVEQINDTTESRKVWMLFQFRRAAEGHQQNEYWQFWTHSNHAVRMDPLQPKMIESRTHYIHNNPVRAGIVDKPEDYLYSSARDYFGEKGLIRIHSLNA